MSPDDEIGGTAKGVRDQNDPSRIITQFLILDVRSLENLIPLLILSESKVYNNLETFQSFEKICKSSVSEVRYFLSLKKGSNLKQIIDENNIKKFWESKIGEISKIQSIDPCVKKIGNVIAQILGNVIAQILVGAVSH